MELILSDIGNSKDNMRSPIHNWYKFSENGQGDVLASAEENGNDNIHLPSAISALSAEVEEVLRWRYENYDI